MKKYNIIDESGDRKYYTQIPNMVINHSTSNEQSLYLIMKRIAGEHGSCYASLNSLSQKMGVHKTTVANTIKKLLKREWIREIEPIKVIGGKVRQFIMIDLWSQNIKEYKSGAGMTTIKSGAIIKKSGAILDESGAKSDTKNNHKNNYKKNYSSSIKKPFFNGEEMRKVRGKWFVLPADNSQWLEFAAAESEIDWR